ncbi:hypothetical protein ABPG75_009184 [Micractinium tetrahymenae]
MAPPSGGSARRRHLPPRAPQLVLAALLAACLLGPSLTAAQQLGAPWDWQIMTDMSAAQGWQYSIVGPPQQPFARPPPQTLDPLLLDDFAPQLNLLQDVSATGENLFTATSEPYVATLHSAFVEGEAGLVYDSAGRVFHPPHFHFNRTSPLAPMPQRTPPQAAASCEPFSALATVVQRFGAMYYHFLEEALPRVALLQSSGLLTSDVKLLTWGQPYEYEYLDLLGIPRSQVVPFNASRVYCADRLLVPTPTPRITPPREALGLVRRGLGVQTLPEGERNLLIYVSRADEPSRRVANEEALLAAIRAAFPEQEVAVFKGDLPPQETIELFQRARLVVGPHGAGLSHILFSAPGTTVVEFLFLADPPLMFWHTAAALAQPYWLLPVPQAYWMQEEMQVPVDEVIDILAAALPPSASGAPAPQDALFCFPGSYASRAAASGTLRCTVCPIGTYAFAAGSPACKPCAAGRFADVPGTAACRTCQPGTYSVADGTSCLPCPAGTFSMLPGAWSPQQCATAEERRQAQEDQALNLAMLSKLSPVFAEQRRRLIEQGSAGTTGQMSLAELCAAQQAMGGGFNDAYRGPYLAAMGAGSPLLANCSQLGTPIVVVASPPPAVQPASPPPSPVELPPVEVPALPPALLPVDSPAPPPAVPVDPRTVPVTVVEPPVVVAASPPPSPGPSVYPEKKKVVDDYVIILACVLGSLVVLPLLAWLLRRCYLARQHRKARAATAPLAPGLRATFNPAYDAEDAASNSSGTDSAAKLGRASPL